MSFGTSPATEQVPGRGRHAKVIIVEDAGVNIYVGGGVAHAAESDVNSHQTRKVEFELSRGGTGARGPVVATESKDSLADAGAIHNDGVGNPKGTTACRAVSAGTRSARGVGNRAATATDHDRTRIERWRSGIGVDDPEFPKLIAYKEAAAGIIVDWAIGRGRSPA